MSSGGQNFQVPNNCRKSGGFGFLHHLQHHGEKSIQHHGRDGRADSTSVAFGEAIGSYDRLFGSGRHGPTLITITMSNKKLFAVVFILVSGLGCAAIGAGAGFYILSEDAQASSIQLASATELPTIIAPTPIVKPTEIVVPPLPEQDDYGPASEVEYYYASVVDVFGMIKAATNAHAAGDDEGAMLLLEDAYIDARVTSANPKIAQAHSYLERALKHLAQGDMDVGNAYLEAYVEWFRREDGIVCVLFYGYDYNQFRKPECR